MLTEFTLQGFSRICGWAWHHRHLKLGFRLEWRVEQGSGFRIASPNKDKTWVLVKEFNLSYHDRDL